MWLSVQYQRPPLDKKRAQFMVLPYRPEVILSSLGGRVRSLVNLYMRTLNRAEIDCIQMSWRLSSPHLCRRVTSISETKEEQRSRVEVVG